LRWLAMDAGFEKLIIKNKKLIIHFVSNQNSDYYQSKIFQNILFFVQTEPTRFRMKESPGKLTMVIDNINGVNEVYLLIQKMILGNELID
ncbi:MAG: hypothetical protein MI922_18435, partial [Bacteroidales bacterium]|nr:hypothetical protein [Bacteroidales bacterium]